MSTCITARGPEYISKFEQVGQRPFDSAPMHLRSCKHIRGQALQHSQTVLGKQRMLSRASTTKLTSLHRTTSIRNHAQDG